LSYSPHENWSDRPDLNRRPLPPAPRKARRLRRAAGHAGGLLSAFGRCACSPQGSALPD